MKYIMYLNMKHWRFTIDIFIRFFIFVDVGAGLYGDNFEIILENTWNNIYP